MLISLEKRKRAVQYIMVLFVIMATDTVSLPIQNNNVKIIFLLLFGITAYILHLLNYSFVISKTEFYFILMACVFCLLSQLINWDMSFAYEYKIGLMLLGFCIAERIRFEDFSAIYVNIITFIALFSLLVFLSVRLGFSWWTVLPLTNNGEYYSAFFSVVPVNLAYRQRLFGPFWEPGAFQAYLNLAILFLLESEIDRKKKIRNTLILILALIFTFSTTGYIVLIIVFGIYLNSSGRSISPWQIVVGTILIMGIIYVANNEYIQGVVFNKIYMQDSSLRIRLKGIEVYFNEWLKRPIFGNGVTSSYNSTIEQFAMSDIYHNFKGTTATTFREFASFGIVVGVLRLIMEFRFVKGMFSNKLTVGLTFVMIMVVLNTEDFIYSLLFNTIFVYGLDCVKEQPILEGEMA